MRPAGVGLVNWLPLAAERITCATHWHFRGCVQGIYVDGIKEETLLSAEHALQVIAMGNEHRKTSATAFNEGSSRSHTIIRLTLEASDRADDYTDPNARLGRTLSFLNLIDLAGSESAKVQQWCCT